MVSIVEGFFGESFGGPLRVSVRNTLWNSIILCPFAPMDPVKQVHMNIFKVHTFKDLGVLWGVLCGFLWRVFSGVFWGVLCLFFEILEHELY